MDATLAMLFGYIFGWFSVTIAYRMFSLKTESTQSEAVSEDIQPVSVVSEDIADRQWREQMNEMLNYDAGLKGGENDED